MKPIRVLLVDDHTLVRAGLRSLMEEAASAEVVGEAESGEEALAMVQELQPAVVVMDLAMAGMNGLEATRRLIKAVPKLRVLILSMYANEEYVRHAFEAGATGYLLKRAAVHELGKAVKQVAAGDLYLNRDMATRLGQLIPTRSHHVPDPLTLLTPRQREILQLIAESRTTKEIALMLELSAKTVEFHRAQLMDRLQIFDVAGLVRFAVRVGLVLPE